MMLKEILKEYHVLTLECINLIENDKFSKVQCILGKRQNIIENINVLEFPKEEFKDLVKEFNIIELETRLKELMNNKKSDIKKQMSNVRKAKKAHNVYNSNFINNSFFLKKRI